MYNFTFAKCRLKFVFFLNRFLPLRSVCWYVSFRACFYSLFCFVFQEYGFYKCFRCTYIRIITVGNKKKLLYAWYESEPAPSSVCNCVEGARDEKKSETHWDKPLRGERDTESPKVRDCRAPRSTPSAFFPSLAIAHEYSDDCEGIWAREKERFATTKSTQC